MHFRKEDGVMDLGMMTGKGALRLAKQESGLTQKARLRIVSAFRTP